MRIKMRILVAISGIVSVIGCVNEHQPPQPTEQPTTEEDSLLGRAKHPYYFLFNQDGAVGWKAINSHDVITFNEDGSMDIQGLAEEEFCECQWGVQGQQISFECPKCPPKGIKMAPLKFSNDTLKINGLAYFRVFEGG